MERGHGTDCLQLDKVFESKKITIFFLLINFRGEQVK